MTDFTQTQLRIIVERAVRPVMAVAPRKRQFREELLAHLTAVFEEELEKGAGEAAALAAAGRRFGNPADLTAQLQSGVSRWDRVRMPAHDFFAPRFDQTALRSVGRASLAMGALSLLFFLAVLLLTLALKVSGAKPQIVLFPWRLALVEPVFVSLLTFVLVYIPIQVGRALYEQKRSWPRVIGFLATTIPVLPGLVVFFHGALLGELTATWPQIRLAIFLAPLTPLAIAALARVMWQEFDQDRQWAQLPLDEAMFDAENAT